MVQSPFRIAVRLSFLIFFFFVATTQNEMAHQLAVEEKWTAAEIGHVPISQKNSFANQIII
jgi:hypothetical protein